MRTFFTADHHFGHDNIIGFSKRPFADIREHDDALVENWNSVVGKHDRVFHLGDFAMRKDTIYVRRIFDRLNGQKFLITGNHDKKATKDLGWSSVEGLMDIAVDGQRIILCHYALRTWTAIRRGAIHVYGHSHGKLAGNAQSCDVGVDCWDYTPVDLDAIKARLAEGPPIEFQDGNDEVFRSAPAEIVWTFGLNPWGELHVFQHGDMPEATNLVRVRFSNAYGILEAKADDFIELRKMLGVSHIERVVRPDVLTADEIENTIFAIERMVMRRLNKLRGLAP